MNRQEFDTLQDDIFTRLENDKRSARMILNTKVAERVHQVITTLYYAAPFALVYTGMQFSQLQGNELGIIVGLGGLTGAWGLGFLSQLAENKNDGRSIPRVMSDATLFHAHIARPLTAQSARKVSDWVATYPRLLDIFAKWGSNNPGQNLNTYDVKRVENAVQLIEGAHAQHEEWTKQEFERKTIEEELGKHGLMDRIKSTAQHETLTHGTTRPSASTSLRRI